VGDSNLDVIDATGIASSLMGDSIATNAFMLGFAFQKGTIPLSLEAIMRAIELNGAAVEMNRQSFSWGRLAAHEPSRIRSVLQFRSRTTVPVRTLKEQIATRAQFLTDYQDKSYADRYLAALEKVRNAEINVRPDSTDLTKAVANNLFKLMAYKDEYEVARLYTDDTFASKLGEKFDGDFSVKFHLAPPLFAKRDKVTGHLRKSEYGGWMVYPLRLLARLKFLRGTVFDPFGYTTERKTERKLIDEYLAMLDRHIATLKAEQIPMLAKLARVPEMIRGYGHIKDVSIVKAKAEQTRLEADLDNSRFTAMAAE
jgi:indolepyruvate ferredoxin oxidoreductase